MCIRDSLGIGHLGAVLGNGLGGVYSLDLLDGAVGLEAQILGELLGLCLLYTSRCV